MLLVAAILLTAVFLFLLPFLQEAGSSVEILLAETGEVHCSFACYKQRVFKATGSTKMYYSESKNDPLNQRNLINFRHYFICMPKKEDAGVVMMSGYQA